MALRWLGSEMRKGFSGAPLPPAYWPGAGRGDRQSIRTAGKRIVNLRRRL